MSERCLKPIYSQSDLRMLPELAIIFSFDPKQFNIAKHYMKRICLIISLCLTTAWILFVVVAVDSFESLSTESWLFISAYTIGVAVGAYVLPYLGYYVIRKNQGAIRLSVLLSVIYVLCVFAEQAPYEYSYNWADFIYISVVPIFLYWGSIWVISGFLREKA